MVSDLFSHRFEGYEVIYGPVFVTQDTWTGGGGSFPAAAGTFARLWCLKSLSFGPFNASKSTVLARKRRLTTLSGPNCKEVQYGS